MRLICAASMLLAVPGAAMAAGPEAAVFTASGKFNNIYGVMVSRLPPVPGVLAYDRDRVIDAKSGAPVASGF